jgi:uncharacterized protein
MKYAFTVLILMSLILFSCKTSTFIKGQNTNMKVHVIRLKPGQDLKQSIQQYVIDNNIKAGWLVSCAGSLTTYAIRFANQPVVSKGDGHFEIVSLTGTVSINGSHIHMAVSDSTGKTIGGHVADGNIIYTTAEIVINESNQHIFTREKDGSTPYEELQIKQP